jgi:release factor glutamine methyltransferase
MKNTTAKKATLFFADCARVEAGEPLAYLIGSIPFLDCQISLDSHPLIPRPETEYWVEKAITEIKSQGRTPKILDLCAGSGAIGIAVAKANPETEVTFAEIDTVHVPTIKKNLQANLNNIAKYEVVQSDLFQNVTGTFDFILTNPPYIDKAADTVEDSVIAHEPALALFGGVGGMEIIARIIAEASTYLTQNGQLWIEHEPFQCGAIAALAAEHRLTVTHHHDQYGTDRYSIMKPLVAE